MPSKRLIPSTGMLWCASPTGVGGHLYRQPLAQRGGRGVARADGIRRHGAHRHTPAVGLTFARGHARLRALIPSREDFRHQADALRERTPPTPAITAAASWRSGHSGCWYSPPQDRLVPEHRDRLRSGGGRLARVVVHLGTQGMIALHLCAIAYTSWRQRSNLVTRMLPGRRARPVPGSRNPTSERSRGLRGPCSSPSLPA